MSDIEKSVTLPPHLWETLEVMAAEMGVSQEGLIGQAIFQLARLNGYVVPGKLPSPGASMPPPSRTSASNPPARAAAAPLATKPSSARRAPEPEPEPEPQDEEGNPFDQDAEAPSDEPLENSNPPPEEEEEEMEEPAPEPPSRAGKSGPVMTLSMAGREPFRLTSDSMLVGRGKHCDFVIESNRVSREHARLSRQGQDFIIEDLKSSNGTFYGPGKERLAAETPRKLRDGDEITFGTEKVKISIKK